MHQLQLASIMEKNKISNTTAWIVLLEIIIPGLNEHIRICYNNANIEWGGFTWLAFNFELGEVVEDRTELAQVVLRVSNVNRAMGRYLEQTNGAAGASVILRVVNTANLDAAEPDREDIFSVETATPTAYFVEFKLGADAEATLRRPFWIYQGRHCRWKFKSVQCGYSGAQTYCNKTKGRCDELGNVGRWGAEFGISGNLYER